MKTKIAVLFFLFQTAAAVYGFRPNADTGTFSRIYYSMADWFSACSQHINNQPGYSLIESSTQAKNMIYIIALSENGSILSIKPSLGTPGGEPMMELIKKASPFPKPPNDLPQKRGLVVIFSLSKALTNNTCPSVDLRYHHGVDWADFRHY